MKGVKSKELINKLLIIIIIVLFVSNAHYYSKSKELQKNSEYAGSFASAISIAAHNNDYGFLKPLLNPNNPEDLVVKFDKLKTKIGNQYSIDNYILIDYHDNNKLVIKTIQDIEGKYYIRDIFFLDNGEGKND